MLEYGEKMYEFGCLQLYVKTGGSAKNMDKYAEIKNRFEENRDPENAVKMEKYMRNLFTFYGISTPKRKKLYRDMLREEKKKGIPDWTFFDKCYEDEHREFQYAACDFLAALNEVLTYEDIPQIRKYVKSKPWWDTIDSLDRIIGEIGLRDKRVDNLMLEWSADEDIWVRRIAIDHQLLRKEKTNTELLEKIIVNNLGSREFFINKAIGWSLRDYSKTDSRWVKEFIGRHREQMDKLSIREAEKYMQRELHTSEGKMQIKEYNEAYYEQVIQFLRRCMPESGRCLELDGRHKIYCNIESTFENFWCLFDGENVVGTAALKKLADGKCELKSLYLLQSYHGKGLGRQLLNTALREAEKKGITKIYLDSLSSSIRAISLYKKAGFIETKRYNENTAADVFMVLELGKQKKNGEIC